MTEFKNDGGAAYPESVACMTFGGFIRSSATGMSRRDYFAGQALAGWLTRTDACANSSCIAVAIDCYRFADAMIAARSE